MRPAVPGTAWIADQVPSFASREKAVLVIASAVFFGPIPMKEKSKSCPWTLSMATALLETGSGSGSTVDWANKSPLRRSNKRDVESFFMIRLERSMNKNITGSGECRNLCRFGVVGRSDFRSYLNSGRCLGLVCWPSQLHRKGGNEGKEKARELGMRGQSILVKLSFQAQKPAAVPIKLA